MWVWICVKGQAWFWGRGDVALKFYSHAANPKYYRRLEKSSFSWRYDNFSDLASISMCLRAVVWVSRCWSRRWVSGAVKIISYTWDLVVASPAAACQERHGVRADTGRTGFAVKHFLSPTVFLSQPLFNAANEARA